VLTSGPARLPSVPEPRRWSAWVPSGRSAGARRSSG